MRRGDKAAITVAVLGAGVRGVTFGEIARESPHLARVVAVAEPRPDYRRHFAGQHQLSTEGLFQNWQEFAARPRMCDAVIITTMDREHVGAALSCLEKGYHVLLEKPMATTLEDCQSIEAAQRSSGSMMAVCHSMRYHKSFHTLKQLVDSGRIGRLVTLDQIEQVAFWHQAHSFVRGNWANESRATFMLMSKSCHDLDYISFLVNKVCLRVSSFGALTYFCEENAPPGSTERCTDGCEVEPVCPYSAVKQYVLADLNTWPASVVTTVHTREAHLEAIRSGPYGRCVYRCDNDAVDHQVVALEFEANVTATFTMTAFTQQGGRRLRVHGTEGEMSLAEDSIVIRTFADNNIEELTLGPEPGGHGGGDARVVRGWLQAIQGQDPSLILTTAQESLKTHTIVFAAERARHERRVVEIAEMAARSGA